VTSRVAVVADIRPGKRDALLEIVRDGPPFDLAESGFDEHVVLVGGRDVVFVFRGAHPHEDVRRLVASRVALVQLSRLGTLVANPRLLDVGLEWRAGAADAQDAPVAGAH